MSNEALTWAIKYYNAVTDPLDVYQTSKFKIYRENALYYGALHDENSKTWIYKADIYLIKHREYILDKLGEFFDMKIDKFLHLENYAYELKSPLQIIKEDD